jgi:glycosyltransferase involved in cell wall biosynthesis
MKTLAKVAVITRTKDRPVFLQRAMRSVLHQTYQNWVHVIVNDGGDPESVDLLAKVHAKEYKDRLVVVHHAESKGMQNASNAGLEASDSTYATIHDDDDSWYPDFLEETVGFLEEEGPASPVQGVVSQTTQVFEEINIAGEILEISKRPYYPFDFVNLGEMCKRNLFAPIAFLYRRSAHDKVGLFRQDFDVLGDHDFNLRFLRHFEIGVLPTFHAYYHWRHGSHGNTVTRARGVHRRMLSRLKNTYHRERLDNPAEAVGDLDDIDFPEPDRADPVPFRFRGEEPEPARAMPDFKSDYDYDILSLDIFDTVLRRRCHRPKDVFKFLEERAVRELGIPAHPYALAREQAEQLARKEVRPEITTEVTLEEIYGILAKLCGLKAAQKKALLNLELKIEGELLYGDPRWIDLYNTYKAAGQRIIFVSDMYLDSATVVKLLGDCGFADAEVYMSCEYHASKHEGVLQQKVAAKLGVDPGRILHVGDNFQSDYMKAIHAGWQAFHWSQEFNYTPMFAQVDPFIHDDKDLLSSRLMGEVERLGLIEPEPETDLFLKLGREIAGPLYLAYMRWVLSRAREDGVRKLLLIGRDGYYWEKALQLLPDGETEGLEFSYIHASRKVYNFASFHTLDEVALEFLKTPNPALRVRDFIERTGLSSDKYHESIRMAGFPDPEEVLTNEMGGQYLHPSTPHRLDKLLKLISPDLEELFARDREGTLSVLDKAGFSPKDCAFVDIGWNGSCIRPVGRLLGLDSSEPIKAYFFGTWKEASESDGAERVTMDSFFIHMSEPADKFQLVRESVNLIEALHAAPYPTLLAFQKKGDLSEPVFSNELKSGFSIEQQERLWKGAEQFLRAATGVPLPTSGNAGGHVYINLSLSRFLREPSPDEVKSWGSILHSDGFGIEVYKPIIEPVTDDLDGEQIMEAYRGSSWKRGFLSAISDSQRAYVLERIQPSNPKTFERLRADLEWKSRQADEFWGEKEKWKWEAGHYRERAEKLAGELAETKGHLEWKIKQCDEIWAEKNNVAAKLEKHLAGLSKLEAARIRLEDERDALKELVATKEETISKRDEAIRGLSDELAQKEEEIAHRRSELESLGKKLAHLEGILGDRLQLIKLVLGGKLPPEPTED